MDDPQIAELKELVRQNIALTQETARMVRSIRNAGRFKSVLFWLLTLASLAFSVWSYYYFVAPRIAQIENIYNTTVAPLQGATSGISDFLKNFSPPASSTPAH